MASLSFLRPLPEIESPGEVPFRRKAAYTAASLLVFFAGSHLPLNGMDYRSNILSTTPPFQWIHTTYAATCGSIMTWGTIPVHVSEAAIHLLWRFRIVEPDRENLMLLPRLQKMLGILLVTGLSVGKGVHLAGRLGTASAILATQQLILGSVTVMYLDEALGKGYGLLPGVPLFTAANICATLFWKAVTGVHATTWAFFLLVLSLQGLHIPMPLRITRYNGEHTTLQTNYSINISYLSYAPLILQAGLLSVARLTSELLYLLLGENKLVNLLGKWEQPKRLGQGIPVGGLAYYLTTPPTWHDALSDPVHVYLYAMLLLAGCTHLPMLWCLLSLYSERYMARVLGDRIITTPAESDPVPPYKCRGLVLLAAAAVGFCVGALTLLAGFMGVIGSGTGIMLAVTIIYSYFDGRATDFGFYPRKEDDTATVMHLGLLCRNDRRRIRYGGSTAN